MNNKAKLALAVIVAVAASLATNAVTLTYEQAVQRVKAQRASQNLNCDSVNFYAAQTDTVINNHCCIVNNPNQVQWLNSPNPKILVLVDESPLDRWNDKFSYYYLPLETFDIQHIPIVKYDGTMRPYRVTLAPIETHLVPPVRAITSQTLLHNPMLARPQYAPIVGDGNNTHVMLMAAHSEDAYTFTYRWNECASLYRVLTQTYGINRSNIHIFMGDSHGTCFIDSSGNMVPFSRDLDGDGLNEDIVPFEYGSLDDFIELVADSLAQIDINHLFTFYTGTIWEYTYNPMEEYDPKMAEGVDVSDFRSVIYRCQAEYNTVFCCCRDADYVTSKFTSDENNILIAANTFNFYESGGTNNGNPEIYFGHWLAAISGGYIATGTFVDADYNSDGYITMAEADMYAENAEVGNQSFLISTTPGIASQVSFGHINLYKGLHLEIQGWESPDIWVRNQNDGLDNQEQDVLTYDSTNPSKYVYVRISNQSADNYDGDGVYLQLYWKKPILGIANSILYNSDGFWDKRGYITTIPLNSAIAGGQDTIVTYQWALPSELINFAHANNNVLPVVVMAQLTRSITPIVPKNVIATNGLLRLNVQSGPTIIRENFTGATSLNYSVYNVNRIPVYYYTSPYRIGLSQISQYGNSRVYSRDSLSIELSPSAATNAITSAGITVDWQNPATFKVNGIGYIEQLAESNSLDSMVINIESDAIILHPRKSSDKISFNIYSRNAIESSELSGEEPKSFGSMPIEFIVERRNGVINPPIIQSSGNQDNSVDLSTVQVSTNTDYSWYNHDGLMGTGESLHLNADDACGIVQLIAIDNESGYVGKAYADLDKLVTVSRIEFVNNGENVDVMLTKPTAKTVQVQVVSSLSGNVIAAGQIAAGGDYLQLPASGWPIGIYLVSVLKDGNILRTVQLMKQ